MDDRSSLNMTSEDQLVHDEMICITVWIHDTVIYTVYVRGSLLFTWKIRSSLFFTVEV